MTDPYKGRYCKDCDFFNLQYTPPYTACKKVTPQGYSPTSGPKFTDCTKARKKSGECGPEGKLWEPIDPTPKTG